MIRSTRSANRHEVRYLLFAFLPPLLVGALFAGGWAVDYQATGQVDRLIAELTPETRPSLRVVGNYSYEDYSYGERELDGNHRWQRLSLAADEVNDRIDHFTRTFDVGNPLSFYAPTDDWPTATVLEQILADAAPIIQQIADAANELDGGLVERDVPVVRLLMHRLRLAVHQGDQDTALETLRWIYQIAQQSDQSSQAAMFSLQTLYGGINETLAIGFWQTEESIQQVRDLVDDPLTIRSAGSQIIQNSHLDALATIDRDRRRQTIFGTRDIHTPSRFYLHLLEDLQHIEQHWDANPMAIHQDIRTRHDQSGDWTYLTVVGIPHADLRWYNSSVWGVRNRLTYLAETEYRRGITSTLVAIKQYQLATGEWPQSMNKLSKVDGSLSSWGPEIERTLQILPTPDDDRAVLKRPRNLAHATDPKLGKFMRSGVPIGWFDEDIVQ